MRLSEIDPIQLSSINWGILRDLRLPFGSRSYSSSKYKRERLKKYQKVNTGTPCDYCGCKVHIRFGPTLKNLYEPNLATIEHVYSRWDIRRALCEKTILACQHCNHKKDEKDKKAVWGETEYEYLNPRLSIIELLKHPRKCFSLTLLKVYP